MENSRGLAHRANDFLNADLQVELTPSRAALAIRYIRAMEMARAAQRGNPESILLDELEAAGPWNVPGRVTAFAELVSDTHPY